MAEFSVGDAVISLCGHDAGDLLIVTETDGDYAVVCDGKRRKADKRKRKKNRHLQATGLHTDLINNVPQYAVDANIRREIKRLEKLIQRR